MRLKATMEAMKPTRLKNYALARRREVGWYGHARIGSLFFSCTEG
jgi:hypothetical protein